MKRLSVLVLGMVAVASVAWAQAPTVTNVAPWSVWSQGALIQWTTDVAADSQIEYGLTSLYGQVTPLDTEPRLDHSQSIYGLTPLTVYHYRVRSANGFGGAVSLDRTVYTPDGSGCHVTDDPLAITELAAIYTGDFVDGNAATGRLVISWLTREPADSQVEWGLTPFVGVPGLTPIDFAFTTAHTRSIGPLIAGQLYNFRVRSRVPDPKTGAMTVYCANGAALTAGLPGVPGPPGPQGLAGPAGTAGTDGTAATMPTGALLFLALGQAPPAGYTLLGRTMYGVQQATGGYVLLTMNVYRKD